MDTTVLTFHRTHLPFTTSIIPEIYRSGKRKRIHKCVSFFCYSRLSLCVRIQRVTRKYTASLMSSNTQQNRSMRCAASIGVMVCMVLSSQRTIASASASGMTLPPPIITRSRRTCRAVERTTYHTTDISRRCLPARWPSAMHI